jgi:hypothetical protein
MYGPAFKFLEGILPKGIKNTLVQKTPFVRFLDKGRG